VKDHEGFAYFEKGSVTNLALAQHVTGSRAGMAQRAPRLGPGSQRSHGYDGSGGSGWEHSEPQGPAGSQEYIGVLMERPLGTSMVNSIQSRD
jgi:hypothetical protein